MEGERFGVVAVERRATWNLRPVGCAPRVSLMAWVSSGCGLTSMKVRVLGGGVVHGLAEPHRVAQVGHPVVGIEQRRRAVGVADGGLISGIFGAAGARSASALRNSGRIGSMVGWCDATSTSTRRANRPCASTTAITASTCSGGPAITVCCGEAYTATVTSG